MCRAACGPAGLLGEMKQASPVAEEESKSKRGHGRSLSPLRAAGAGRQDFVPRPCKGNAGPRSAGPENEVLKLVANNNVMTVAVTISTAAAA